MKGQRTFQNVLSQNVAVSISSLVNNDTPNPIVYAEKEVEASLDAQVLYNSITG